MKVYLLLACIFVVASTRSMAQDQEPKHIREKLFGADYKSQIQKTNNNQRVAPDPRSTATSTRSLIFTNYQPQTGRSSKKLSAKRAAAPGKSASDISQKEAAANAPKPTVVQLPVMQEESNTPAPAAKKN